MPRPFKAYRIDDDAKLDLSRFDTAAQVVRPGDEKDELRHALQEVQKDIGELQNRLFAEDRQSLLVVLQGMDTSGKDGTTIAMFGGTHPQGLVVTPFKAPSEEEAAHDFLWRAHARVPARRMIGVFNRSHYEAVIAERVLGLADKAECRRRYAQIVDFERMLTDHATVVLKLFLHISPDEQKKRLQARIDDPAKHWKFNPNDLVERKRWDLDLTACRDAIRHTATKRAPWWIVPADHKDHRNLMAAMLVRDTLAKMNPQYPELPAEYRDLTVE